MARDYQMTGGFLDGFQVSFDKRNSILAEKSYPLGTFATEYLELDWHQVADLDRQMHTFVEEFTVFLSARDPSSAAVAQQALDAVWASLRKLPVYRELDPHESAYGLLHYMREHPDEVDDMLTPGTGRNQMMERWLGRMRNFWKSIDTFVRDTELMLMEFFKDLESRRPEDYAEAYGRYRQYMDDVAEDEEAEVPELDRMVYPVEVSYRAIQEGGKPVLVEQMEFGELASFLYCDLYRGMAAGNLPQRCDCCGHWFLAIGAYDTRYCTRVAPGEAKKTCRQVGPHRKEKRRNGDEFIRREYQKAYNRLKGRKHRGSISTDEWNRQVALAQEFKAQAEKGQITDVELRQGLDRI